MNAVISYIAEQMFASVVRICSTEYRVYTKEWCGFNSENY
jgi:hypothetical protein